MPTVTYNQSNPLVGGLSGLAGALEGEERGRRFKEEVRQFDTTHEEGVRQYDTTHEETQRQFDQDLAFRIEQLEVLQQQNALDRDQQTRLENLKQKAETFRTGAQLQQSTRVAEMQEGGALKRAAERERTDRYRISEQTATQREQNELSRQMYMSEPSQRMESARAVLSRYGDHAGFVQLPFQQQQEAAMSLAAERVGPERWAGTGDVPPATETEKDQAFKDALRDLRGFPELEASVEASQIRLYKEQAEARANADMGIGPTRATSSVYASEIWDTEGVADPRTGLFPTDYTQADMLLGEHNSAVLRDLDFILTDAAARAQDLRLRGAGHDPSGQIRQYWDEAWIKMKRRMDDDVDGFRAMDRATYQSMSDRYNYGLSQAVFAAYSGAGQIDIEDYIDLEDAGMSMAAIDAELAKTVEGQQTLMEIEAAQEQDLATTEQFQRSRGE